MASAAPPALKTITAFIACVGPKRWAERMSQIERDAGSSQRVGRALAQQHAIEITLERLRRAKPCYTPTPAEICLVELAREAVLLDRALSPAGRTRFRAVLIAAMQHEATLVPMFHLLRTALLQRRRGFTVTFAGLENEASYDLLLERDGAEAELVCDVLSAEDGRDVHRGAWVRLVDGIDEDLQTWLSDHPGRYLLKLTLPQGLNADACKLQNLQGRIRTMLASSSRQENDEACVLRLDPLMLAAAQIGEVKAETTLLSSLRREFGHQAHLAVTTKGTAMVALAARAGREDEVAVALRRRLAALAPTRLSGTRPGILAMFIEDTDRTEWRHLRDRLELEGETRQFLTFPEAKIVVAVTCASRLELLGGVAPDAACDGELRFRNPAHPAAKVAGLAPAVLSSV